MMKRISINKGYIGLVFKQNDYIRVLTAGKHWLRPFESLKVFNLAHLFYPPIELDLLLQDEALTSMLDVFDVKDSEMAVHFVDNRYAGVLNTGRYAHWKEMAKHSFVKVNLSKVEITEDIPVGILYKPELLTNMRVFRVEPYENALLFINDQFVRELNCGVHYFWKNNTPIIVMKADLRLTQLEISGQELLTKDKAALRLSFFATYKVVDVMKALTENQDYTKQLHVALQLSLREYVGSLTLDELLERKEEVTRFVVKSVKEKAMVFGIELMDGGIRDIILPGEVREIMNQVLVAQKKAQANSITRREETASTRSLLNTAKLMEDNQMLFKLKEMEYVEKIADKINNISLSGGGQVVDQLKSIFSTNR